MPSQPLPSQWDRDHSHKRTGASLLPTRPPGGYAHSSSRREAAESGPLPGPREQRGSGFTLSGRNVQPRRWCSSWALLGTMGEGSPGPTVPPSVMGPLRKEPSLSREGFLEQEAGRGAEVLPLLAVTPPPSPGQASVWSQGQVGCPRGEQGFLPAGSTGLSLRRQATHDWAGPAEGSGVDTAWGQRAGPRFPGTGAWGRDRPQGGADTLRGGHGTARLTFARQLSPRWLTAGESYFQTRGV